MACERYSGEKSVLAKTEQHENKADKVSTDALTKLQDECRKLQVQNQNLNKENRGLEKYADGFLWVLNEHVEAKDGKVEVKPGRMDWKGDTGILSEDGHVTKIEYGNGKSRELQYDHGRLCGYVGDDGAAWKTTDGLHWKRPDTGAHITGVMQVDSNTGEFSFLNLNPVRNGEKPHLTTVSADNTMRTDDAGPKFEGALAKMVEAAFDKMPRIPFTQNVGRDQVLPVMLDNNRSPEERAGAGILLEYLKSDLNRTQCGKDEFGNAVKHVNFQQMLAIMDQMSKAA